jgi:dienelactone hydrolase
VETPLWFPSNNGVEISALFLAPDGWLNLPVVVFCTDELAAGPASPERLIARDLTRRGVASLMLDFSAHGAELRPRNAATLALPIQDLASALDALRTIDLVNVGSIGVYGSGLGGTIAMLRASIDPRIRTLALRSPRLPDGSPQPVDAPSLILVPPGQHGGRHDIRNLRPWFKGPAEIHVLPNRPSAVGLSDHDNPLPADVAAWFVNHIGTGARQSAAA